MTFLAVGSVNYSARIGRAELLASRHSFASEILSFYILIAKFQKQFAADLPKSWGSAPKFPENGQLRSELNIPILVTPFESFLSLIESHAPAPLAAHAHHLRRQGLTAWSPILSDYWQTGLYEEPRDSIAPSLRKPRSESAGDNLPLDRPADPLKEFLSRAFLQPYAEFLLSSSLPPAMPMLTSRCPRCNSLPLIGVMRPEGDGAKRYLQCSFCSNEWEFRRIFCARCGEDREPQLPVYVAEQFPHIRMDTCDTCKHFLRTIDLTKDGNAIPIVDDLAALPLSLWAAQQGYTRIQSNLLAT
jgi:formate dehydrogenase maturation protein FdhE